ncbi:hypothetical protein ACQ86D_27785 [Streptomyces galilaeus]
MIRGKAAGRLPPPPAPDGSRSGPIFHGSIIYEHAGTWLGEDVYVDCSGNFTIEALLHARFGDSRRVHGNDIQAYSCALG